MRHSTGEGAEMSGEKQVRPDVRVASRWRRLSASVLDTMILVLPLFVLGQTFTEQIAKYGSLGILFGVAAVVVYYGVFDGRSGNGQTLGKRVLDIQTVALNGGLLSPQRAAFRALVLYAPLLLANIELGKGLLNEVEKFLLLLMLLLLAALIYYFFLNKYHRSVHDMVTATIVVRRSSSVPATSSVWSGHYAGVILFGRNVVDAAQLRRLTTEVDRIVRDASGLPPLFAADHEGGRISVLASAIGTPPTQMAIGRAGGGCGEVEIRAKEICPEPSE